MLLKWHVNWVYSFEEKKKINFNAQFCVLEEKNPRDQHLVFMSTCLSLCSFDDVKKNGLPLKMLGEESALPSYVCVCVCV